MLKTTVILIDMDIITIIGILGASIILLAFLLNQFGKWSTESFSYDVANVIGSGILIVYAYLLASWPFMALNAVWFLVSLKGVVGSVRR